MASRARNHGDLVRYTPGGCLIVDNGIISAANAEAVETTGIPMGRLIGVALADFVVPEQQPILTKLMANAGDSPTSASLRLVRALTPVELTVRRLPDDLLAVGVRSMASEHYYSALAKADLTHDALTGFSNRYHLLSQLQERLNTRPRHGLAIVGLWIDELPSLASTRGVRAVERVIKDVGVRLQGRLRSPDVLGRFSEAGFVSLLTSDAQVSQLTAIAGRLRDEVTFPVEFDDALVSFTASVAVASLVNRKPTIERIMIQLDAAGDRAAATGGNRTETLDL